MPSHPTNSGSGTSAAPFSKDEFDKILRVTDEKKDFAQLVQSLSHFATCATDGFSIFPPAALSAVGAHFGSLSSLSAFQWIDGLIALLKSTEHQEQSTMVIVSLICSLIDNVPLMNANKLRAFVKNEIVCQCVAFWRLGQSDLASALSLCVLQTLLMELSYLEAIQSAPNGADLAAEAREIWQKIIADASQFDPGPFLQLSTSLFYSAIGTDCPWTNESAEKAVVCLGKCAIETERDTKCNSFYCASLFNLLSRHLLPFCQMLPDDVFRSVFEFLIGHSQRNGTLECFLKGVASNAHIRYGESCEKTFSTISALILSSSINLEEIWGLRTKGGGTEENATERVDERLLSWDLLLSLVELPDERLAEAICVVPNAKIENIVFSADFNDRQPRLCLRMLNSLSKIRRSLLIPLRNEIVELILAEEIPKIRSLQFSAKLLEVHAHSGADSDAFPAKADFVSFCLAIFQPIDKLDCEEEAKRDFLLAELSFLRTLFSFLPQFLPSFAPLIVQLIPEFFVWANFYRKNLKEWPESRFVDRLEHSLTSLCREIVRRKKCFNKLLPYVISSSLTGDRELRFPMYLLFSALDENDWSLLSSNLAPTERRKFSQLKSQFYARNKIIG